MAKMPKLMGKSSEKIWSYWSLQYEGKEEKEKNIWSPQWRSSESYQSWGTILRLLALDIQNLKLMVSRLFSLLCILTLWPIFVGQHFGPTFFAKPIRVGQIFFFFFIGMEWFMVVEPAFLNISLINILCGLMVLWTNPEIVTEALDKDHDSSVFLPLESPIYLAFLWAITVIVDFEVQDEIVGGEYFNTILIEID